MPDRRLPVPRTLVAAVVALAVLAATMVYFAAAGTGSGSGSDPRTESQFVTRSGTTLRLDGSVFRFVGFNLYDAAASDIYSCSPSTRLDDDELADAMKAVKDSGGTVLRFWAYQTYTAGGSNYEGVDRVIAAARREGLRVLPALEDGPGNCSTGEGAVPLARADGGRWYADGYRVPYGDATISYRDYAARITRHYRNNPTILGWSLVNEAETSLRDADGQTVLVDFAADMSAVVHAADPNHLVTLGTQGNGVPGASGSDFAAIYGLQGMDFTEVHDWAFWGSDLEAMPGTPLGSTAPTADQCLPVTAQIACSFVIARQLGKPIVVGEAGMRAKDAVARARRARLFVPKIEAAFDAGASGYLIWQLNTVNTDGYAVRVGSNDPVYGVLRTAAGKWSTGL
jgi:mannan endo-1,4-beta-mannosidase